MDFIDGPATNTSILDEDLKVILFGFAIDIDNLLVSFFLTIFFIII